MQGEGEDEGEEDVLGQEFLPSPPLSRPTSPAGLSLLALSVSVDSARLSMLLSVDQVSQATSSMQLNYNRA